MTAWRCGVTLSAAAFAFASCCFVALGLAADAVELRKTPHRPCHPVGGFLASGALGGLWGKGPQWALPLLVHLAGGLMSRPAASGPVGAWPCIAEGCPRATAGGQLDRAGARRGPALAATLPRPDPAGGWTGRAAARRPGWAGVRPAGRWGRVGRPRGPDGSPHHRPQAVAPFPLPAAAASDGGRVWGVTQQQTAAPPLSAAAQGPAWGPLRCGTAADAHGVPGPQSGPRPQLGPVMLIEAGRFLPGWSGAGPRPHFVKSHLSDTFCTVGRQ